MSNRVEIDRRGVLKGVGGLAVMLFNLPRSARAQVTSSAEQSLVLEDGTRIWYEKRAGKPNLPPIVFIHGNGQNHTTWNRLLRRMGEIGHPVIVYDLAGHGKSEAYRDGQYSMSRFSGTLDKVLSESKVEKPIIVGNSLGGMIALQYTVEHPDKITALVLTSASDVDPAKVNKSLPLDTIISDIRRKAVELGNEAGKVYPFDKNPQLSDEEVLAISLAYTSPQALIGHIDATKHYDVRDSLRTLSAPVLILRGENDSIMTTEMNDAMKGRIKNSRLVPVYKAGHNFIFQKPRLFTGLVEANYGFINQQYRFK